MIIKSTRSKGELSVVAMDNKITGTDLMYWTFSNISKGKWENLTVMVPDKLGNEFNKTYGHYHATNAPDETYQLIYGKGVFLLQEKSEENGILIPEKVKRVCIVEVQPGEEITISNKWGHSWSNLGETPLLMIDNWRSGHTPNDYIYIEKVKGMAYYLVDNNGKVECFPNPNYKDPPKAEWISVKEFAQIDKK